MPEKSLIAAFFEFEAGALGSPFEDARERIAVACERYGHPASHESARGRELAFESACAEWTLLGGGVSRERAEYSVVMRAVVACYPAYPYGTPTGVQYSAGIGEEDYAFHRKTWILPHRFGRAVGENIIVEQIGLFAAGHSVVVVDDRYAPMASAPFDPFRQKLSFECSDSVY